MGYFNIELKPAISAQNCVTAFGNGDLIADWVVKTVPTKKPFRIMGATCIERGTNGASQASQYELIFASPNDDLTKPSSLGTVNGSVNGNSFYNHLVGIYNVMGVSDNIDNVNVYSPLNTDGNQEDELVIEPSRVVAKDGSIKFEGHDVNGTICIGVITSAGAPDFGTGVLLDNGEGQAAATTEQTLVVKTVDVRKALAVGDTVAASDGAAIGTVVSIASDTRFNVDKVEAALENNDEIVNLNPLTFIIHCEY
tara:strand:+ start:49 stop:807 length:759 start_codon:yes stop_codon:yes gene_type:complete